jgi:sortase A
MLIRISAFVMAISGIVIIFSTLYPILSYEWESSQKYSILVSPLVDEERGEFKFSTSDSSKLSSWFPDKKASDFESQKMEFYTISIPDLNIDGAVVALGTEDLSQYLIQYPGTASPGKVGNTVIFGHSILPQYFDPKNYMSIFSTLYKLDVGSQIYVYYGGLTYKYRVEELFEVKPNQLEILNQPQDDSYLSLVTCSPPGHPLKPRRLVVRAKLVRD